MGSVKVVGISIQCNTSEQDGKLHKKKLVMPLSNVERVHESTLFEFSYELGTE